MMTAGNAMDAKILPCKIRPCLRPARNGRRVALVKTLGFTNWSMHLLEGCMLHWSSMSCLRNADLVNDLQVFSMDEALRRMGEHLNPKTGRQADHSGQICWGAWDYDSRCTRSGRISAGDIKPCSASPAAQSSAACPEAHLHALRRSRVELTSRWHRDTRN